MIIAALLGVFAFAAGCSYTVGAGESAEAPAHSVADHSPDLSAAAISEPDETPRVRIFSAAEQTSGSPAIQCIELGAVRQGECRRRVLVVENRTSERFVIDRFETSCDCLSVNGMPLTISAEGDGRLELVMDQSREHEFNGELAIETFLDHGAEHIAAFRVNACVVLARDDVTRNKTRSDQASLGEHGNVR